MSDCALLPTSIKPCALSAMVAPIYTPQVVDVSSTTVPIKPLAKVGEETLKIFKALVEGDTLSSKASYPKHGFASSNPMDIFNPGYRAGFRDISVKGLPPKRGNPLDIVSMPVPTEFDAMDLPEVKLSPEERKFTFLDKVIATHLSKVVEEIGPLPTPTQIVENLASLSTKDDKLAKTREFLESINPVDYEGRSILKL